MTSGFAGKQKRVQFKFDWSTEWVALFTICY